MAGFTSPQFLLGLSSPAGSVQPGCRSMLAYWAGGACSIASIATPGVHSMLAHWMGGACAGAALPIEEGGGGMLGTGMLDFPDIQRRLRERRIAKGIKPGDLEQEDDDILAVIIRFVIGR